MWYYPRKAENQWLNSRTASEIEYLLLLMMNMFDYTFSFWIINFCTICMVMYVCNQIKSIHKDAVYYPDLQHHKVAVKHTTSVYATSWHKPVTEIKSFLMMHQIPHLLPMTNGFVTQHNNPLNLNSYFVLSECCCGLHQSATILTGDFITVRNWAYTDSYAARCTECLDTCWS